MVIPIQFIPYSIRKFSKDLIFVNFKLYQYSRNLGGNEFAGKNANPCESHSIVASIVAQIRIHMAISFGNQVLKTIINPKMFLALKICS